MLNSNFQILMTNYQGETPSRSKYLDEDFFNRQTAKPSICEKANSVCSTAVANISAKAISDASTNQVLGFLLYLSNWSLQKTLLPFTPFSSAIFPTWVLRSGDSVRVWSRVIEGWGVIVIALEFGVEWLRGEGWWVIDGCRLCALSKTTNAAFFW